MIDAIMVLAVSTGEAISCFIWYKIGFKRGQKDMLNKIVRIPIAEKAKKEKDV